MLMALFYVAATIALLCTGLALSRANAAHALIYLIMSLLAIAVIFFIVGAPFAAALLNLGESGDARERQLMQPGVWLLPGIFALILLVELLLLESDVIGTTTGKAVVPKQVGLSLFGTYVLAVEIASMLLLAGLVGAYHVGRSFLVRNRGIEH